MKVLDIGEKEYSYFAPLIPEKTYAVLAEKDDILLLGLEEEGAACGVLAGWLENGRLYLYHLYVAYKYRNKGGACLLLGEAERLLDESGRGKEMIAAFGTALPGHRYLADFFVKRGYRNEPAGAMSYCAEVADIFKLPLMEKLIKGKNERVRTLAEVSKTERFQFLKHLRSELGRGAEEGLDEELTILHFDKAGRMDGYMANGSNTGRSLIIQIYSWVDRGADPQTLLFLIGGLLGRAKELAAPEAVFCLQPVEDRPQELVRYLLKDVINPASVYLIKRI